MIICGRPSKPSQFIDGIEEEKGGGGLARNGGKREKETLVGRLASFFPFPRRRFHPTVACDLALVFAGGCRAISGD